MLLTSLSTSACFCLRHLTPEKFSRRSPDSAPLPPTTHHPIQPRPAISLQGQETRIFSLSDGFANCVGLLKSQQLIPESVDRFPSHADRELAPWPSKIPLRSLFIYLVYFYMCSWKLSLLHSSSNWMTLMSVESILFCSVLFFLSVNPKLRPTAMSILLHNNTPYLSTRLNLPWLLTVTCRCYQSCVGINIH